MREKELEVAVDAARAAGKIIRGYYQTPLEVKHKGENSPVTRADIEADRAINSIIAKTFPADGWLSEETTDSPDRLARSRVWIVDPLDGTNEFIRHVPEFCVCIALVEDGVPTVAVSYDPVRDRTYAARAGAGTTVNGTPARTTATTDLHQARVLASRSESARGEWDAYSPYIEIEQTGSVAFKLARVAAGDADATFTLRPKNEWDICAGVLLIQEAGGMMTEQDGTALRFNKRDTLLPGLLASNGHLHEPLLQLIRRVASQFPSP